MKAKFYSTIILLLICVTANAQSERVLTSGEYDNLKRNHALPQKFLLRETGGSHSVFVPRIQPSANTVQNNTTCNCLLPLDTTFSVVPFINATPPEYRNDDESSAVIPLPFTYCFFGTSVDSIYINNNGNISFGNPYVTFTSDSFPNTNFSMVAPFWGDVDTRGPASGPVYYKMTPTALIIKWEHVGYFSVHGNLQNTFQLIITDGSDPLISGGSNTAFCYGDMQWTTGEASGGTAGFGGTPSTVGANLGDGINYIQFGRFDQAGYGYDGPFGANDSIDWLDSSSFAFDLCSANVAPMPYDCNNDSVYLRLGDTTSIDVSFIDPNPGQVVNISVNGGGLANLTTISNTSGNLARYIGTLVTDASNLGYNTLTLTATDNGSPARSVSYNRIIHIDQVTGIQPVHPATSVAFFPNPFSDQTQLNITWIGKDLSIIITDVTGREVYRAEQLASSVVLNKGDLVKGIYFYRLTDGKSINEKGKLIVQ
ncbi:MAG: T9SS type A sorting domain-containing protein [Bacteroidetes bacterium]|nr:T9SS type A sorting domain-containing protein [Bacteroidota bacterium]